MTGTGAAETLTGNSGGAVGPTAGNINTVGTGSITVVGNPGTNTTTVQLTGLTNHDVLVGAGSATITSVSPSTSGFVLTSNGVSADPSFQAPATSGTVTSVSVVSANGFAGTVATATTTPAITLTTTITGVLSGNGTAISGSAITQHDVLLGGATNAITSVSPSTAGLVLTSNGVSADPSFQTVGAAGGITSITGNSGGAEVPSAGNFNILGTGSITIAGSANTETVQLTGLTNHAVLVGAGTATITKVGPSATTGQVLQNNSAADPTYSTATYPSTTTINQILYSSAANTVTGLATANDGVLTTGTTGIPVITALASDGQVIIGSSAGAPAAATLTAGSGVTITNGHNSISISATGSGGTITTIDGDTGSVTGSTVTIYANNAGNICGSSVEFVNSGTLSTLNVTDGNQNTIIGQAAGNLTISGTGNGSLGFLSSPRITSGSNNQAFGNSAHSALTTGSGNCAFGTGAGEGITTGSENIAIGHNAGINYTSSESSNILIVNHGSNAESNVIRIGTQGSGSGQQNTCYIAGIEGVSVSNLNYVTINTATGQMGSVASITSSISITGDTGGALTGSAFTFTGGTTGLTFAGAGSTETLGGDLIVANGGTGKTSFTAYSVICAGTTSTGVFQNVSGVGTAGQVLTSNGASALPSWQSGASVLAITTVNHAASPYTVLAADEFLAVNVSGGVVTITLPNAPTTGRIIRIKDSNGLAATSNISITTVGGTVTIDGQTTYTMATNYQSLSVVFDGSNYEVF